VLTRTLIFVGSACLHGIRIFLRPHSLFCNHTNSIQSIESDRCVSYKTVYCSQLLQCGHQLRVWNVCYSRCVLLAGPGCPVVNSSARHGVQEASWRWCHEGWRLQSGYLLVSTGHHADRNQGDLSLLTLFWHCWCELTDKVVCRNLLIYILSQVCSCCKIVKDLMGV